MRRPPAHGGAPVRRPPGESHPVEAFVSAARVAGSKPRFDALVKAANGTVTKSGLPTRAEADNAMRALAVIMREQRAARKGAKVEPVDELLQALEILKARATAQTLNKGAAAKTTKRAPLRAVAEPDTLKGVVRGAALRSLEENLAKARQLSPSSTEYAGIVKTIAERLEREYKDAKADLAKAATPSDATGARSHMSAIKRILRRVEALPAPGGVTRIAPARLRPHPKLAKLRAELADVKKAAADETDPTMYRAHMARAWKIESKIAKLEDR